MSKKTSYSAKNEGDDLESLGERLAADLRKGIRQLVSFVFVVD
jgi:hypothetical protein